MWIHSSRVIIIYSTIIVILFVFFSIPFHVHPPDTLCSVPQSYDGNYYNNTGHHACNQRANFVHAVKCVYIITVVDALVTNVHTHIIIRLQRRSGLGVLVGGGGRVG